MGLMSPDDEPFCPICLELGEKATSHVLKIPDAGRGKNDIIEVCCELCYRLWEDGHWPYTRRKERLLKLKTQLLKFHPTKDLLKSGILIAGEPVMTAALGELLSASKLVLEKLEKGELLPAWTTIESEPIQRTHHNLMVHRFATAVRKFRETVWG